MIEARSCVGLSKAGAALALLLCLCLTATATAQVKIPETRIPLNQDQEGSPPEFGPHSCLVAFVITGGTGGHPTLGKGANRTGQPSKASLGEIANGVKKANEILNQCDVQFHLCWVQVIDASKVSDPASTKKLAEVLFDKNGKTLVGEQGKGPDPVGKLYATIEGLPQFKATAANYENCAFLFFVKDVVDPKSQHEVDGVGGAVGTKKKPVGVVEGPEGSTIAHELVHGLGHDGHADDPPKPGDKGWQKETREQKKKSAEKAQQEADRKEAEAAKAEADAEAARKAAEVAEQAAKDAADAAKAAEAALEAEKERAYQTCRKVRNLRERIKKKNDVLKDPKATSGQKKQATKKLRELRGRLEKAKEKCWDRYKNKPRNKKQREAAARAKQAEEAAGNAADAAKKAADEAAAKRKAADDARQAADTAQDEADEAEDAKADAENLMDAVPAGSKLEQAQCEFIRQSIKDNLGPCPCG